MPIAKVGVEPRPVRVGRSRRVKLLSAEREILQQCTSSLFTILINYLVFGPLRKELSENALIVTHKRNWSLNTQLLYRLLE